MLESAPRLFAALILAMSSLASSFWLSPSDSSLRNRLTQPCSTLQDGTHEQQLRPNQRTPTGNRQRAQGDRALPARIWRPYNNPETITEGYGSKLVHQGSDCWCEFEGYHEVEKPRWTRKCTKCGHTYNTKPVVSSYEPDFENRVGGIKMFVGAGLVLFFFTIGGFHITWWSVILMLLGGIQFADWLLF